MGSNITREYSFHFHKRTTAASPPNASWPTDVEIPFTDYASIVVAMRPELQVIIGMSALKHLSSSAPGYAFLLRLAATRKRRDLHSQVMDGLCTVLENAHGEVERVTTVLALRILRPDGRVLVQLGSCEDMRIEVSVVLPGSKIKRGESPDNVRQRLLWTKLAPIAQDVAVRNVEMEVFSKVSTRYKLKTTYLRTVWNASFAGSMQSGKLSPNGASDTVSMPTRVRGHQSQAVNVAHDVYAFQTMNTVYFYAWLSDTEFEELKQPGAEDLIAKWLTGFDLDQVGCCPADG